MPIIPIKFFADIDATGEVEGDTVDGVNYKINGSQGSAGQVLTSNGATSGASWESVASGSVSGNTFAADLKIGRDADNHLDFATADDTIDVYINGQKDFTFTANTFTAQSGSTIAGQAITGTTIDATTDFTIGSTVITDDRIVMTPSPNDTVTMSATTNGAFTITTLDATIDRNADLYFNVDGQITYRALDDAGHIFQVGSAGVTQVSIKDGIIEPETNNDIDLGSDAKEFKNAFFEGTVEAGAFTIGSTNILSGGLVTSLGVVTQTDVQFTCDNFTVASSSSEAPNVLIKSTSNDALGGVLYFDKRRTSGGTAQDSQDEDVVGNIVFRGHDDGSPSAQEYAKIIGSVQDASSGAEEGQLDFQVASHDGELATGLSLFSGDQEDEIDVKLGNGANCRVTIPGNLIVGTTTLPTTALQGTADRLATARAINGVDFDGSAAITVTAAAGTLTGTTLKSTVVTSSLSTVGTIGTGVWQGTAIASAYLDADTAHLSGNQTFTGTKTFSQTLGSQLVIDGNTTAIPGDGVALHIDGSDITDASTSESGTAAKFALVNIEAPRLIATNASVTTTDAATLYINNAPTAATNQTIARPWALWVDAGNIRFDGSLYSGTTEAMNSSGLVTVANQSNITGVGTISSGTWQGTAIASAYMASATDSAKGAVELATTAEAVTGTDTARAVTPAGLKARVSQIINLKGYATLQDDVYDYANPYNTDDEAPFQMDTSYGSGTIDSSTEVNQKNLFRSGGFHVPFACTISTIQTQVTCSNAGNVSIAVVEYRPSDASGDQNDYPRTVYETIVNASDDNNNKVDTVTIATGDLDNTAVPAGSHIMMMVKGDSTSAGGTTIISTAIGLSW